MAALANSPGGIRPKRFALEIPLEFRRRNADHWSPAKTEDVSVNGALLRARESFPPQTPLDVKLRLPTSLTGDGEVQLLCSAYVVRSLDAKPPSQESRTAIAFVDFRLSNGKPQPMAEIRQAPDLRALFHRLNSLLFIIAGNAEMLALEGGDESKARDIASRTQRAADDASAAVRSLAALLKSA